MLILILICTIVAIFATISVLAGTRKRKREEEVKEGLEKKYKYRSEHIYWLEDPDEPYAKYQEDDSILLYR